MGFMLSLKDKTKYLPGWDEGKNLGILSQDFSKELKRRIPFPFASGPPPSRPDSFRQQCTGSTPCFSCCLLTPSFYFPWKLSEDQEVRSYFSYQSPHNIEISLIFSYPQNTSSVTPPPSPLRNKKISKHPRSLAIDWMKQRESNALMGYSTEEAAGTRSSKTDQHCEDKNLCYFSAKPSISNFLCFTCFQPKPKLVF